MSSAAATDPLLMAAAWDAFRQDDANDDQGLLQLGPGPGACYPLHGGGGGGAPPSALQLQAELDAAEGVLLSRGTGRRRWPTPEEHRRVAQLLLHLVAVEAELPPQEPTSPSSRAVQGPRWQRLVGAEVLRPDQAAPWARMPAGGAGAAAAAAAASADPCSGGGSGGSGSGGYVVVASSTTGGRRGAHAGAYRRRDYNRSMNTMLRLDLCALVTPQQRPAAHGAAPGPPPLPPGPQLVEVHGFRAQEGLTTCKGLGFRADVLGVAVEVQQEDGEPVAARRAPRPVGALPPPVVPWAAFDPRGFKPKGHGGRLYRMLDLVLVVDRPTGMASSG